MSEAPNTQTANQPTGFDYRIMEVSFAVNGKLKTYNQDFHITAKGEKFANPIQNTCNVGIANLDKETRNYLLTATSPFNQNKTPKTMTVKAGRVSTGLFLVYQGEITTSKITQPSDIILELKCGTLHSKRGHVGSRSGSKHQSLHSIAQGVAGNLGLSLNNQAKDRSVGNYSYNGNAVDEVQKLKEFGCDAYIDDNQLVLKERRVPVSGSVVNLSKDTGMIGVPEITEKGLKVKFLFTSAAKLGGGIQITSELNPSANGLFVIYKLNFDLASRDVPFYYLAECVKAKT